MKQGKQEKSQLKKTKIQDTRKLADSAEKLVSAEEAQNGGGQPSASDGQQGGNSGLPEVDPATP